MTASVPERRSPALNGGGAVDDTTRPFCDYVPAGDGGVGYTCQRCGALVPIEGLVLHRRWHQFDVSAIWTIGKPGQEPGKMHAEPPGRPEASGGVCSMEHRADGSAPLPAWTYLDLWNMHTTLARIIANGLDEFRVHSAHSYPGDGITWDGWKDALAEMAAGFHTVEIIADGCPQPADFERFDRAMGLFVAYFMDLWD